MTYGTFTIKYHELVFKVSINFMLEKSNKYVGEVFGKQVTLKQMCTIVVCLIAQFYYVI